MSADQRHSLMFEFAIDGDLRFISHHDTLRLFRRACARADLPLRFSQGFNPQPKLTLPLPRPVGVASSAEVLVIELDEPVQPDEALSRLRRQMPDGITLRAARAVPPGQKPAPDAVRYRLELQGEPADDINQRIQHMMDADTLHSERTNPKNETVRSVDIRPFLLGIDMQDNAVEFTLRVTGGGSARPGEIAALLGLDARYSNLRIRRMEVKWR